MPAYKYKDAYFPNSNHPLGSLAPLGSFLNPYPPGHNSNHQSPGSARPAVSTETAVLEARSSPEAHTWSPPVSAPPQFIPDPVHDRIDAGNALKISPPATISSPAPSPTTTRQVPQLSSITQPRPPLPTAGGQRLIPIAGPSERDIRFSEDCTPGGYHHSPQQARSGPAVGPARLDAETIAATTADQQRNSSALHITWRGLPTQSSSMRTSLTVERRGTPSPVTLEQPSLQSPRPCQQTSGRISCPACQPLDREFAKDAARAIITQLSSLLPENQPGLHTSTDSDVYHPILINNSISTDLLGVDDLELRRAERARPWEPCEICGKKPHLVTEMRIKFCHSCYGEAVAAEKALGRRRARRSRN